MAEPKVTVYGHGVGDEFPDGPPTAVVSHQGIKLVLRFAPGDLAGEGALQELRVLPDTSQLEPRALRRFAPQAELYLSFARAAMRILGSPESEPWESFRAAAQPLREIAGPGRRLSDEFYRQIARTYEALTDEGEPHPVKALSEIHSVTISAASRWVSGARDRGFLPPKNKEKDEA
jgi:hypothetical protein